MLTYGDVWWRIRTGLHVVYIMHALTHLCGVSGRVCLLMVGLLADVWWRIRTGLLAATKSEKASQTTKDLIAFATLLFSTSVAMVPPEFTCLL